MPRLISSLLVVALLFVPGQDCRAQTPGVSVSVRGGLDWMLDGPSGPAAEVVAGYRMSTGVELLGGLGTKLKEGSGACPDGPGAGCTRPFLERDFNHGFAEFRYRRATWDSPGWSAEFVGVRLGWVDEVRGPSHASGPTVGATVGAEYVFSSDIALSTAAAAEHVSFGDIETGSWRLGLRVGIWALLRG